jgi:metal-sulfur cluster biosynthetic enzyme
MDRETKLNAVRSKLARVVDPELDESLTELGFVESIDVDANDRVHVCLRLPTYWCAANFAFMMASDARERIAELPWVKQVLISLADHFYSDRINEGVAQGPSFAAAFREEASGELDELRAIFKAKAFERRQHEIVRYLLAREYTPEALVSMTIRKLEELDLADAEGDRLRRRYLEARWERRGETTPQSNAFVQVDGKPLALSSFPDYLARLRRTWLNTEVNGALCRGLLEARYRDEAKKP